MKTIFWAIEDEKGKLLGLRSYGITLYTTKKIVSAVAEKDNGERPVKVEIRKVEE